MIDSLPLLCKDLLDFVFPLTALRMDDAGQERSKASHRGL
jgi:hypothetical protein